jgi:hypothetical protein
MATVKGGASPGLSVLAMKTRVSFSLPRCWKGMILLNTLRSPLTCLPWCLQGAEGGGGGNPGAFMHGVCGGGGAPSVRCEQGWLGYGRQLGVSRA